MYVQVRLLLLTRLSPLRRLRRHVVGQQPRQRFGVAGFFSPALVLIYIRGGKFPILRVSEKVTP